MDLTKEQVDTFQLSHGVAGGADLILRLILGFRPPGGLAVALQGPRGQGVGLQGLRGPGFRFITSWNLLSSQSPPPYRSPCHHWPVACSLKAHRSEIQYAFK